MCLCAFLSVLMGEKILMGRYADHPAWENLAGMESERLPFARQHEDAAQAWLKRRAGESNR